MKTNVFHHELIFETKGNKVTTFEIKQDCLEFVKKCQITNGILVVQSAHTTCAVFFEEVVHDFDALGDEYLQYDLYQGLNRIFPKQMSYDADYKYPGPLHLNFGFSQPSSPLKSHPAILLNGDAHCKATLVGSSKTFVILDGQLCLGKFGSIYFVDFDGNRARKRNCHLCIIGG